MLHVYNEGFKSDPFALKNVIRKLAFFPSITESHERVQNMRVITKSRACQFSTILVDYREELELERLYRLRLAGDLDLDLVRRRCGVERLRGGGDL